MKTIVPNCNFIVPICGDRGVPIENVPDEVADAIFRLGNCEILGEPDYESVYGGGNRPGSPWIPEVVEVETPLTCPKGNSTKAAWVKWALSRDAGLTEESALGMSKVQLMSQYGERL